jgi:hypothetical protein
MVPVCKCLGRKETSTRTGLSSSEKLLPSFSCPRLKIVLFAIILLREVMKEK